ncbi:MAG TPA: hypothetical protein VGF55_13585 [Gemmataceae bacterium]
MTRRRLILVACVAQVALTVWAAWWLSVDRLSAEEQALVGTWEVQTDTVFFSYWWEFRPDRHTSRHVRPCVTMAYRDPAIPDPTALEGRWHLRDGALVVDVEPGPQVSRLSGIQVGPTTTVAVKSLAPDRFVLATDPGGGWKSWVRTTTWDVLSQDFTSDLVVRWAWRRNEWAGQVDFILSFPDLQAQLRPRQAGDPPR